MHLLRHGQHVQREDDGAVQFWRTLFRPKPIRTMSGFFGISRFEFDFCRCVNIFLKDSIFFVCSYECAVACLCPRISISTVVASSIHDDKYIYISMKPLWKVVQNVR